jgi:hypothetical protein
VNGGAFFPESMSGIGTNHTIRGMGYDKDAAWVGRNLQVNSNE